MNGGNEHDEENTEEEPGRIRSPGAPDRGACGNTRDTCEAAALASQQGAKIISVTSYVNSQLARMSDVVLQTFAKEEIINGGRITGLVSQLYVLDCLKREYNKRNRDRTVRLKEEIGKAILSKKV